RVSSASTAAVRAAGTQSGRQDDHREEDGTRAARLHGPSVLPEPQIVTLLSCESSSDLETPSGWWTPVGSARPQSPMHFVNAVFPVEVGPGAGQTERDA